MNGQPVLALTSSRLTWSSPSCTSSWRRWSLLGAVRWFEDRYTVCPEWPDECYINHSFEPCGLWHLGFVFALTDLCAGAEITVDYRHLLAPGQREDFDDAVTGRAIVGYDWRESLRATTAQLHALMSAA